jgi:hypothetical protein
MRVGLLARQDIAVSVPAQHADPRQSLQQPKDLSGTRAEQDKARYRRARNWTASTDPNARTGIRPEHIGASDHDLDQS